jgi:hypothetical protein
VFLLLNIGTSFLFLFSGKPVLKKKKKKKKKNSNKRRNRSCENKDTSETALSV